MDKSGESEKPSGKSGKESTERKDCEAVRQRSGECFRTIIEKAPIGILIICESRMLFLNDAALKIWGFKDAAEAMGKSMATFIAPSCREEARRIHEGRIAGRDVPVSYDTVARHPDGTEFPLHVDTAAVELNDRPAIIYFFKDISDRKRIEEALRVSAERLSLALHGSGDGYFDLDCRTGHVVTSDTHKRRLGYDPEELEPGFDKLMDLIHPEDKPAVLQTLHDHFDGKTDFYETDKRYLTKSGDYKWIRTRGRVCTRDAQGKPLRMLGTYTDISRRKKVEEELRNTLAELEQRVAAKTMDLSEANTAMKVLLNQLSMDRQEIEESVAANIMGRLIPHVNKLKLNWLNADQKAALALLEEDLHMVISPFLKNLQGRYPGFTPQEIQVADLIRRNKSSKEIARQLNISANTVDLIRYRIRKKLNINNKKIHLGAYLSAI